MKKKRLFGWLALLVLFAALFYSATFVRRLVFGYPGVGGNRAREAERLLEAWQFVWRARGDLHSLVSGRALPT
jgi:hypothetical protein